MFVGAGRRGLDAPVSHDAPISPRRPAVTTPPPGALQHLPTRATRRHDPARACARPFKSWRTLALVAFAVGLGCANGRPNDAEQLVVQAAVAANFAAAHTELVNRFEAATEFRVQTSLGSTGQLYAQILNGAPYDVFLAADTTRPHLLQTRGAAVPNSRFTYAIGQLALYAPGRDPRTVREAILRNDDFVYLAIANPETAPYGAAAREVLQRWGLWESLESRAVRGEDVGQALQFVESDAAEVGLLAYAQLRNKREEDYWLIPDDLYEPIRQGAVLLSRSAEHAGALAFLAFLQSPEGRAVIADSGYRTP